MIQQQQSRFHAPHLSRFNEAPPPRFQPPPIRPNNFSDHQIPPYQKKGRWDNPPPDNQIPPYERRNSREFNRPPNEWDADRRGQGFPPPPSFQKVKSFGNDRNSFDRDYRERGPPMRDEYYDYRGGPVQNQYNQGPPPSYDDRAPYRTEWSPREKNYNGGGYNGPPAPRSFRESYPNDDRQYPNDRSFPPLRRPIENRKFDVRGELPSNFGGPPPRFNNFRLSRFSQPQFRRWGVGAELNGGRGNGFAGRRPWGFVRDVAREELPMNIEETSTLPPPPTYNRIRSRFSKITDDTTSAKATTLSPEPIITDTETKNILQLTEAVMDYKLAFALAALDLKSINFQKAEPEVKIMEVDSHSNMTLRQDDHQNPLQLQNPDKSPRYGGYGRESRTPHDGGRPYDNRTPHDGGRPYDNRTPHEGGRPYDNRTPHDGGRPYDNRTPHEGGGRPYDNRTPHEGRRPYDNRIPNDGRPYDNKTPHRSYDNRTPTYPRGPPYQTPK